MGKKETFGGRVVRQRVAWECKGVATSVSAHEELIERQDQGSSVFFLCYYFFYCLFGFFLLLFFTVFFFFPLLLFLR